MFIVDLVLLVVVANKAMHLTPQQKKVVEYLADGNWHCLATPSFFMKDDRKRISELNALGYTIEGIKCDGRCGQGHTSPVKMRRMVNKPLRRISTFIETEFGTMREVITYA